MTPLLAYGALAIAIVSEVCGTSLLQKSAQFTRLWPTLGMATCFVVSMFFLSQALKLIPLGIAYAIWAGLGIVLTAAISVFVFRMTPRSLGAVRHRPDHQRRAGHQPSFSERNALMTQSHHRRKQPDLVRRNLLEHAMRLAESEGLSGVTVQAVAAAAGVTKGGLFHHFPSKQALIEAMFADVMARLDADIEAPHCRRQESERLLHPRLCGNHCSPAKPSASARRGRHLPSR